MLHPSPLTLIYLHFIIPREITLHKIAYRGYHVNSPPPETFLSDKKGGELVWYRDPQDFSSKKEWGELVWYEILDFFFVKIVSSRGILKILVKYDFLG